jgi:intracellular septation protein A
MGVFQFDWGTPKRNMTAAIPNQKNGKTMNDLLNKRSTAPQLSGVRTFLFGALAFVWFAEMVQWGFLASSGGWQNIWKDFPQEAPQLATALLITHAIRSAAKGALGVMAVFGMRSKNPTTRTVLFVSMALVPPLNIVFPCRADGFPMGTTAVAAIFSIILWVSFLLFKEPAQQLEQKGSKASIQLPPSRWDTVQYIWFAINSTVLTLMAFLFLFAPRTALDFIFPSMSGLLHVYEAGLSSMTSSNLSSGTHLLALAIASWVATAYCRSNPTLRRAMTVASTIHAGLICLLPLRRVILEIGGSSATSSILVTFAPLLIGWAIYLAFSSRVELKKRQEAYI